MLRRRTKLARQPTLTPRIIRDNPQDELNLFGNTSALVHLGDVVKSHHPHPPANRIDDVSPGLGGISVDDAGFLNTRGQGIGNLLNQFNLCSRGAVEVTTQAHESTDDGRVGVALDGIVGNDSRKGCTPSCQLRRDDAQIDNVEGIFNGVLHPRL